VSRTSNLYPDTYMLTDTCCPATSCSSGIHVDCNLGDIILLFIYVTVDLYPLYPATDGRQTGNSFVADTRNMLKATGHMLPTQCCRQLVAGQHVSWCKRGFNDIRYISYRYGAIYVYIGRYGAVCKAEECKSVDSHNSIDFLYKRNLLL